MFNPKYKEYKMMDLNENDKNEKIVILGLKINQITYVTIKIK